MDEELIELTTEDAVELELEDVIESEVNVEDSEHSIESEDTIEAVEVETTEEIEIDVSEAVGWVGGDSGRHYSLSGRDERDQHPIKAITGLREELDDIEALKTVHSNKVGVANYYAWNDGAYDEFGYFVSLVPHTSTIKICDGTDIFGVTVDVAGFVGGQDDVTRDNSYGLVATSGLVDVRCESDVAEGDYVVSNAYGVARKTDSVCGYKVIAIANKNGIDYASITLGVQACTTDSMAQQIQHLDGRMDDAETNIITAMNVANAAYNKAGEVGEVSEEAIKNALEALDKSNKIDEKVDELETNITSSNEVAVQAKAIAESAATSAETIRDEAKETSDKTLAEVNDLIKDLEPIMTWQDPESGNTGAEYLTTYINNDLATKAEVYTVEALATDNKSAILKNAKGIESIVSSVDKYSVGEYSQAYGLTHEQAQSILAKGIIYIPTKHENSSNHTETYEGNDEVNTFTPGYYYTWDGADWMESASPLVAFFSEVSVPSNSIKYWYVDSNGAPDGYEAHALYLNVDGQWQKVNILDGNVNNRLTAMMRHTADEIKMEVVNARGSSATLSERIDENEASIQSVVSWSTDTDGAQYNLATIRQTADDASTSIAQVVESVGKDGEVNAASIVTAINSQTGDSTIKLSANVVDIEAGDLNLKGQTITISADDVLGIESTNFSVDKDGKITATEAKITGDFIATSGSLGNMTITDRIYFGDNKVHYISSHTNNSDPYIYLPGLYVNQQGASFSGYVEATSGSFSGSLNAATGTFAGELQAATGSFSGSISASSGNFGPLYIDEYGNLSSATFADMECLNFTANGTITAHSGISCGDITSSGLVSCGSLTSSGAVSCSSLSSSGAISVNGATYGGQSVTFDGGYLYWDDVCRFMDNSTSDQNLKNSIELIGNIDAYDNFFDKIAPVRYKYNNGTSDRYHTGFVAQQVVESLEESCLSTQDFAAVCYKKEASEPYWYLRRDEFVALNTWQIQKMKARMSELESKVLELEGKLLTMEQK